MSRKFGSPAKDFLQVLSRERGRENQGAAAIKILAELVAGLCLLRATRSAGTAAWLGVRPMDRGNRARSRHC